MDKPPPMSSDLNPGRQNPYRIAGIVLVVANVIPGILLFAFVASLIGEENLEGDGALTWLGTGLVFLPPVVGVILIVFGRPLSRGPLAPNRLWVPVSLIVFGVVGTSLGAMGAVDTSRGANIGAGLLLLVCPFLTLAASAWAISAYRNRSEPNADANRDG